MIQGFREPHMTGDCKMAKSVALSILIVAVGAAILKYGVANRLGGEPVLDPMNYVRGTFGWGGVVGGFYLRARRHVCRRLRFGNPVARG